MKIREIRLQNGIFIYKEGLLRYKRDFRSTFHPYNVHFLVHAYPENMKSQFENETLKEVLRYMIMMTIVRLRLDTPDKVEEYLGSGDVDSCK